MSSCGVSVIDSRHQRVDFALTLGEGWTTQVCATDAGTGLPIDLTGRVFNAGLMTADGAEVFDLQPVVSGNCVTLHVTGLATEDEPLGLGVWSWFLREIVPVDEAEYWVGGSFTIYRVNSYAAGSGGCGPDVVEVCLNSTVDVSVGYRVAGSDVEVVASDPLTGRYAVQGPNGPLEQGDTGWITPTLINGWVGTDFQIRRVGDWVQFRGQLDDNASTDTNFLIVGTGFLPGSADMGVPVALSARTEGFGMLYGASSNGSNLNILRLASTTGIYRMNGTAYMPISLTWPTVLPT